MEQKRDNQIKEIIDAIVVLKNAKDTQNEKNNLIELYAVLFKTEMVIEKETNLFTSGLKGLCQEYRKDLEAYFDGKFNTSSSEKRLEEAVLEKLVSEAESFDELIDVIQHYDGVLRDTEGSKIDKKGILDELKKFKKESDEGDVSEEYGIKEKAKELLLSNKEKKKLK